MNDQDKSREQLLAELDNLRQRVGELEAQLARSQQAEPAQRQIHDCLPVLIATAGLDGYYKEVNAAFERKLGWSEQESLARPFLEFVHPDDRAAAGEAFARLKAGEPASNFLDRIICKDGSHRWISWMVIAVPDRDIVFGIGQDTTERKQAEDERNRPEAALRESEERFRKIFEEGPVGIVLASVDGRVQSVNRRFCDLLGYSEREIIELGIEGISHPHDGRLDEQLVARLQRGEIPRYTMEKRFIRKDGEMRWGQLTVSLMRDAEGQPTHAIGMTIDITERKQAETALRESERRLSTLLSNLPGAVYRCKADANWTIEFLNDGYLALTGYEPSQLIGQPGTRHSELIHPDDRQRESDAMQEAIARKQHYQVEYRLRTATGGEKWVWEQGSGIFSDSGELEAIEGFTTDITDRKRAKEELRKANEQLEQRVAERTAELTQANERLQAEVQQRRAAEEKLAIFRRFVEAATQGFGMAGVDGRIIYANPFLVRLLGAQNLEDMVGKQVAAYYPAGYQEHRERVILPTVRRKEPWHGEQMMVFPDGKMHPTIHTVFPVLDDHGELFCTAAVITDITELKETEEELRQSEAKYRALFETCPDAVVMLDLQGRVVFASQRAAEQHGVLSPDELTGRRATDFVAESDRDKFVASVGRLVQEEVHRNVEYSLLRPDGTAFDAEVSSAVIQDAAGNPDAFMAVYRDITERKRNQEKLAVFGQFVEAAAQGFGMSDMEGRVTYMNSTMARLVGEKKPEDAFGKSFSTYHSSEFPRIRDELIRPAVRRDGYWQGELPLVSLDGTVIPTLHNIFAVRDKSGEIRRFAAVVTDITELKQTQERLRQTCEELRISQERFELVVRAAGAGVFDWDIITGEVYYSPRWKELFGYEDNEIGEGFEDWASRLHPDERASIIKRQEDFLAGTSSTAVAEYRLRHKDGSYRWIIAHVLAVRDSEGQACRLVGSHVDITDRKQAEEKVLVEQRALRRMVLANDRERRLITYELHDGVAQQLLGAMLQLESQEPRRVRKSKAAGAHREGMDGLRHAAAELRRVMNWLRTPVLDKFGLTEAIEDVAAQLRLTPGAPEIDYLHDVQFERLEPTLENSLFRIAQEAMTNACRHSQSEKVRVKLTQKGGEVTLEVRDWGIGFDKDIVQENRFGLEGIRERSRILGGKLSIKSEPGKGTVIRAVFPVIEAAGQE